MDNKEQLIKAKIACPETGIEIHRGLCAICSPAYNCGIDAYVKDGKLLKVEGTDSHPRSHGLLCAKGQSNRQFIYRDDRIKTPLRRIGERGEGKFVSISWDEAYEEIANKLNTIKSEYGPDSVAFFGGYNKWYRPWLRRFAHSFGTMNYGTESSACMTSSWIAWKAGAGQLMSPDFGSADLIIGWAFNPYFSGHLMASSLNKWKEQGKKFIIIDPRITVATEKLADLHLRPLPGTDGALAHCMANVLIENSWIDEDFISKYVYGFEAYAEYVKQFNAENVEKLTGVPYEQVLEACRMIHESSSMTMNFSSAPMPHHKNGFQNIRALHALLAITGNLDRKGGMLPGKHTFTHSSAGYSTYEEEWMDATEPKEHLPAVGSERFPLWYHFEREMQAMDLARQINEEKPYPIKALLGFGMNYRMFPGNCELAEALMKLNFFVDTDLFLTDTAKMADIVLPVCSSLERGEFMCYPGGYAWYTNQAIDRVGDCRSDTEIICDLSKKLGLNDTELAAGYEANIAEIIRDTGVTVTQLRASDTPIKVPTAKRTEAGTWLSSGFPTKTGRFEISCTLIEDHPEWGLDPLPTYSEPLNDVDPQLYPLQLVSGGRLTTTLHSRLHNVSWLRSMRPQPMADISLEDAAALGIREGDSIEISTELGSLTVKANPTARILKGTVFFVHGYSEADVNSIIPSAHLDPYVGFPAYNSSRCNIRKKA